MDSFFNTKTPGLQKKNKILIRNCDFKEKLFNDCSLYSIFLLLLNVILTILDITQITRAKVGLFLNLNINEDTKLSTVFWLLLYNISLYVIKKRKIEFEEKLRISKIVFKSGFLNTRDNWQPRSAVFLGVKISNLS